jgi:uncharacterized OB-fold protein
MARTEMNYEKPLPAMAGLAGGFYGWCAKGELRFQRCSGCQAWRHVPRELCPECGSREWSWERSSGHGRVFTWTVATRAIHPGFEQDIPYAAVVVEMDEGVRVLSQVADCPPDELTMDMPVEVTFEAVTPEVTLPKFRRKLCEKE